MVEKKLSCLAFLSIGVFIIFCTASIAGAQQVKVGAGAAPTENVFSKIKGPMESSAGLKLVLVSNGPVQALKDLDQGLVDAASGGLTFSDWMDLMEKEGYPISDRGAYKSRVIGKDIVKVLTHKEVGVKSLSKEQLKGIFTGKVMNWNEVGGKDQQVKIVMGSKIPGTNSVFQKQILDGDSYTNRVVEAGAADEIKEMIAKVPGTIGLGPASIVDSSVAVPAIPEVGRPITLITKGAPSSEVIKMLDYIAGAGQEFVIK